MHTHHHHRGPRDLAPFILAMHQGGRRRWEQVGEDGPFGPRGPFGRGGPFGPGDFGPGGRHGGRARRGNVRLAILHALADRPMNGYQIIGFIESQTDGMWRPSPGAIYPALSQLEDEQMIASTEVEGQKAFKLTPSGEETVEGQADQPKPWDFARAGDNYTANIKEAWKEFRQLAFALQNAARSSNPAVTQAAVNIVTTARRDLYRLLADADIDADE